MEDIFFNRDISWLYFNERVLLEAADPRVPLIERIRFLSIYSSNLDEFYRVRMPTLRVLGSLGAAPGNEWLPDPLLDVYGNAAQLIRQQQQRFGGILGEQIIPLLQEHGIQLVYGSPIPEEVRSQADHYFFSVIAAYLECVFVFSAKHFFPVNNRLYIVVTIAHNGREELALVNIPSDSISRFFTARQGNKRVVLFIDDIIKAHLGSLFPGKTVTGAYSIKITRDAELDLHDEYEGDIAERIALEIGRRELGPATRLLYQPGLPLRMLQSLVAAFNLFSAGKMEGGNYHHLKDLSELPFHDAELQYPPRIPAAYTLQYSPSSLFGELLHTDILVHPPYDSYDTVLRFFNEAAIDSAVKEVYTTLYRVASDSMIAHALMSAARNGKKVMVFVELKARFDEANNIKWAKKMNEAGVRIVYSIPGLKVHAKTALVKKEQQGRSYLVGLLATGNLNENTARFYTDHILLTSNHDLLRELELLFIFLSKRKRPGADSAHVFHKLLVASFNLHDRFMEMISAEMAHAREGRHAEIIIKLNNLEERTLISKLYEASRAGVRIRLIVRSICCLVPGVPGLSENITVTRIVGRYLEHGRVFIFHNGGDRRIFLGSADWMNRNIYRRIEVCFPVYAEKLKKEITDIIDLQLQDDTAAVRLNEYLQNVPAEGPHTMRSQDAIAHYRTQTTGPEQMPAATQP